MACMPKPAVSLPPNVGGPVRGEVLLNVGHLSFEDSASPTSSAQEYQVRIQWWGDRGPGTLVHLLPGQPQALVHFPVCCSSGAFGQYLADMEWLTLTLEDHFNGMLGEAAVNVTGLGETAPFSGSVTFVQWLGSREQRHIAKVNIQVLVSFTPLTRQPAPTAKARPAKHQPLMRIESRRSSHAAAAQDVAGGPEDPAADRAEEIVQGQEAASMTEGQSIQGGTSPDVDTWQDSSAHEAAAMAFGSTLELDQAADEEPDMASLPRPGSGGGRIPGSFTFTPASRQEEAVDEARPVFSFAPYGPSDQALHPRGDFAAQLAAGHISAGLPRLAEIFPAATPSLPSEAVLLPPAASWRLPSTHANQTRPPSVVTGIPVMPMNAATGGFWGPWNGANLYPSVQPSTPPNSGSGPNIDALIKRAERLRAQMTAAVGAASPRTSSKPPVDHIVVGGRSTGTSAQLQPGAMSNVAGIDGGSQASPGRSGQAKSDRAGRLRSAAQRKRIRSAQAGAKPADAGVNGGIAKAQEQSSVEPPAVVATAAAHAGTAARSRPHSAPSANAMAGRSRSVSAAAGTGTRKSGLRGTAGQKAAQGDKPGEHMATQAGRKEDEHPTAAVRHTFEVTILSCTLGAAVTSVSSGEQGEPISCYVCYQFPGEQECLYTNEAILQGGGETIFEATACHSVVLPAAEQVSAPLLFGSIGFPQDLRFELWRKHKDMPDTLCAAAEFPSANLVALAASAAEVATTKGPLGPLRVASRSIALPLTLSKATQQRAAPALAEEGNPPPPSTVVLHVKLHYSAAACANITGADVSACVSKSAAADAENVGRSPAAAAPVLDTHWSMRGADVDSSAFVDLGRYVEQLAEPIQASIKLEVVRVCGLVDAVKAADAWEGGSAALRRAKVTGPNVYACLALLPKQAPQLKLQTQPAGPSFCPEFLAAQETNLSLDNALIRGLATQELRVEVYHTCTRSDAAASKLATGASAAQAGTPLDTLLGTAAAPLTDLLTKPQGICKWVTLKSRQGTAVGVVQLAVRFTHLDGAALETVPSARSPLEQCPALASALPAEAPAHTLVGSSGFAGQPAAATVYIGDVQLPAEPGLPSRAARSAHFFAVYRLPGFSTLEVTGKGHAQHIPGTKSASTATAAQQIAFNHQRTHWVEATEALAHTLARVPLVVTVMRQDSARNGAASQQPVPVGTAEVDLSDLLRPRLGAQRPAKRFLRETRVLVNPKSKSLGSISVKVLLDLDPDQIPPTQLQQQPARHSASAIPPLQNSNAPPESPLSGPASDPTEAAVPSHTRQQQAETSLEYFSRMEALVSAPHHAAPPACSPAEDEAAVAQDDDLMAASADVQHMSDDTDDIIARTHRLRGAVGSLGIASIGSLESSPELSGHLLDWATGGDLTWTPQAAQSESPQQPGAERSALEAWRARFGLEEGGAEALPWETGQSDDDVALREWPGILNGRQLDHFWAGEDSDDAVVIGPSGQGSLLNGQPSAGSDEDDIDALVERFRLSYSRLPGMSNSDSAGSSIVAAEPHAPRSHPAQHGADALSTAGSIACEPQGCTMPLPLSTSPILNLPDIAGDTMGSAERAAGVPAALRRSEDAQKDGELAETEAALSAGINAFGAGTGVGTCKESHAGHLEPPPSVSQRRPGSDLGSADGASVIAPAAAEVCASSPSASVEEGAVLPEPEGGPHTAWECASKHEHQAEGKDERFEEEEEGTPGDRGGLADSAYTLRQAVHALSKGSAMALFAPDAVARADRIKAARGVASPQPDQAPATPTDADVSGMGGCVKAAQGAASSEPDQAPAGSERTHPTGCARVADGVASTEPGQPHGSSAAPKPPGAASRESLGLTEELPESGATGSFLNTVSLPGPHGSGVQGAEGRQVPVGTAALSLGKEAHLQPANSPLIGEADITLAAHAGTAEGTREHQQAGEPSKLGLVDAARIQTCSDDEDFAVLDLGGGYCSSSDGSDEGWRPHTDGVTTYQAPRGALILSSIGADDWMFGLGAMPAQPVLTDTAAASSAVHMAAQDNFHVSATPPEQAAVPDVAPMPSRELTHPQCTFANVLPGIGAPSEADSSAASEGLTRLGSALEVGPSRLGAGGDALGSAARLTISEYFAAAEGFVGEPPGGSPSTARTLSDADLAVSGATSPQSELVLSMSLSAQRSGAEQLPVSGATRDALPAKLAEGRQRQDSNAADSKTPAVVQGAVRKGSPDVSAAHVIFLNALPAAASVSAGAGDGDAQSASSTASAAPLVNNGLPVRETLPKEAPGVDHGGGVLSRREQFRLAVAAAEAERQNKLAALEQEEPNSLEGAHAPAASERQTGAHDKPCSMACHEAGPQHNLPVDGASSREARRTTSHSLDDIDGNSRGVGDGHSPVASPRHQESPVEHASEGTSSTVASSHLAGSHASRDIGAALRRSTAESGVTSTALNAATDAANPEDNAPADAPVLMGTAEVLSIPDPAPQHPPGSPGTDPPDVSAAHEPLVTPQNSGNPEGGPAEGIGLTAEAIAKSISPSEQRRVFGRSGQQELQPTGGTAVVNKAGTLDGARAQRDALAAEASAVTAPPYSQRSAFGSASQQGLQSSSRAAEVDDGVEAGVVTPRRQSTQELIARFSAGADLGLPRPAPTSPLKFLRSGTGRPSPQHATATTGTVQSPSHTQPNAAPPPRPSPATASASYLANLGPPAGRAIAAPLPRSPLTSGVSAQPWSPGQLQGRPVTPRAPPAAAQMPGQPPPLPSAAAVGGPSAAGSPSGFPGHRLRDLEPQAVVPALRRLWGHAPSVEGQGMNMQHRAPVQRLLFPLAGRMQERRSGHGGHSSGQQQDRPSSSQSTASAASAQRSRLERPRTDGGRYWERDHIRVDRRERPAPRRGMMDAEAERIAHIMASHRVQPWEPDGFGNGL